MFASCYLLANIDGLNFNFTGITSANSTCDKCFRMKTPMVKKILNACGATLTSAASMCHVAGMDGYTAIIGTDLDTTRTIPSDLFAKNTNLQNISGFFDITGYTTIPGDLLNPCASTITNLSNTFGRMNSLQKVGSGLLKDKPKLTNVAQIFASATNLTDYFNEDPNIFMGSPNITSTKQMFNNCSKLKAGDLGLGEMMYPLGALTDASYMFYGCSSLACEIPDGFLSRNNNLTKINGMFQRCSALPTLPKCIFNKTGELREFPRLVNAVGVFAKCSAMEGIVDSTFFLGASKLTNIGYTATDNQYMSTSRYPSEGFFEGTKVTGYHETFLNTIPDVRDVTGLFKNCVNLVNCHYYDGSEVFAHNNSVTDQLFIKNVTLSTSAEMFSGCSLIEGHIPGKLLDPCRNTITSVSGMFRGCSTLTGIHLDAGANEETQTGIHSNWFKNAPLLNNVSYFMYGNANYGGEIPEDLFEGCVKLANTSYMFYGCTNIAGGIPLKLFDNCRTVLANTSYMFTNCENLTDPIPTGEYTTSQGIISYDLSTSSIEGAMQVVEVIEDPYTQVAYSDVVTLSPNLATIINPNGKYYVLPVIGDVTNVVQLGLLSECLELTTIAGMFQGCKKIKGGIPHDLLFTSNQGIRFTKLTNIDSLFKNCEAMNVAYIEPETNIKYICDPVLFDKCTALTNCASVFNRMYAMGASESVQIHPNTFIKQTKVTTVYELFMGTPITGAVSSLLFTNCIGNLTNAQKMFAYTNITSISNTFLNNGGVNKKLQQIYGLFYSCENLGGTAPEFWNGAKFTAIQGTQNGYWGALTSCTKLTNYAAAQAVSANWTSTQPIYL